MALGLTVAGSSLVNFGRAPSTLNTPVTMFGNWINADFTSQAKPIMGRHNGTNAGVYYRTRATGNIQLIGARATTTNSFLTTGNQIPNNTWVCLFALVDTVVTLSQGWMVDRQGKIASLGSNTTGAGLISDASAENLYIGSRQGGIESLEGTIGPSAMWNRRLSLREMIDWAMDPTTVYDGETIRVFPGWDSARLVIDDSRYNNVGIGTSTTIAPDPFSRRRTWLRSTRFIYVPTSGVVLAGSIGMSLSAAGALEVAKPLAGSITASVTTDGALTVPKPLSGAVAIALSTTGALNVAKPLAGSVAIAFAAIGALSVPKPLNGSVTVAVTASGALTITKLLAGAIVVNLNASGTLAGSVVPRYFDGVLASRPRYTGVVVVMPRYSSTVEARPRYDAESTLVAGET